MLNKKNLLAFAVAASVLISLVPTRGRAQGQTQTV